MLSTRVSRYRPRPDQHRLAQSTIRLAGARRARALFTRASFTGADGWNFARLLADGHQRGADDRLLVGFKAQSPKPKVQGRSCALRGVCHNGLSGRQRIRAPGHRPPARHSRPHRPEALSRLKPGFESRWGRQLPRCARSLAPPPVFRHPARLWRANRHESRWGRQIISRAVSGG